MTPIRTPAEMAEAAAQCADEWTTPSALRLKSGEMTPQELRTAQAVAKGIAAAIRSLAERIEPEWRPIAEAPLERWVVVWLPEWSEAVAAWVDGSEEGETWIDCPNGESFPASKFPEALFQLFPTPPKPKEPENV